jgi:Peptidase family M28
MGHFDRIIMRLSRITLGLLAISLAACVPAAAQLSPAEPDPLARIRDAAKTNVQACSATGETLCEQVAPKIIANAQGDSPLAENLRRLSKAEKGHKTRASKEAANLAWAAAAFLDAGADARIEKYANPKGGQAEQENVVAEFRGRENPDDWVLLGAHLSPREHGPAAVDSSCDAATVIEAARDILRTGVHPRRSIRFVLFTGDIRDKTGSWAYVRAHRSELDQARAAIIVWSDCRRVTSYLLNGRPELEPSVREATKPIESLGAIHFGLRSSLLTDGFDFLLEGVPALTTLSEPLTITLDGPLPPRPPLILADLKHNAALVAVTAFGIAERAAPLGPRQTRSEVESSLRTWGLDSQMKNAGLWSLWESGKRGRLP